jgi:hypothetical protein
VPRKNWATFDCSRLNASLSSRDVKFEPLFEASKAKQSSGYMKEKPLFWTCKAKCILDVYLKALSGNVKRIAQPDFVKQSNPIL